MEFVLCDLFLSFVTSKEQISYGQVIMHKTQQAVSNPLCYDSVASFISPLRPPWDFAVGEANLAMHVRLPSQVW